MTNSRWKTTTIQEFVDNGEAEVKTGPFGTQMHASDYVEQGTPVINVRNIGFGSVVPEKLEYIGEETVDRLKGHLLRKNDIVFGRKGAVERHALIRDQHDGWFQGSDCLRLRVRSPELSPIFLSYCFLTDSHQKWMMNQCSHGATMASLNQAIVCRIPLKYPDIRTQNTISGLLSAYDDLIETNTRRTKILEQMAQMLYREWFVNFRFPGHDKVKMVESEIGPIPQGWGANTIGDLCDDIRRSVNPSDVPAETPYIGLEHMPRKSIALSEWGEAGQVQSTKLRFNQGDILFGKIRPYFHKVGTAPINGVCSSDAIVIVPKEVKYSSVVLLCASSDDFVAQATQTSQGTKMPRANWGVLARYPIAIPDLPLLERFNGIVVPMIELLINFIFRNRCLRKTRDLLLPKLVSGEVSVEQVESEVPAQTV